MNIFFSPRLSAILKILAEKKDYVPTSYLAEQLGVSTRTVFREIQDIDFLLAPFGISLKSKSGYGYKLVASDASIKHFFEVLEASVDIVPWATTEERRNLLMMEILQAKDAIKLMTLASLLSVSEGTISRDLDYIEPRFEHYNIELIRKPGLGIEISGDEENIRKAITDFVHESFIVKSQQGHDSKENLYQYFDEQESGILGLLDRNNLNKVIDVISNSSLKIMNRITEHSFIGLVIHLTVAINRIQSGEAITMDPELFRSLQEDSMYRDAKIIAGDIEDRFKIEFPKAEIGYILMHLRGTRPRYLDESQDIGFVLSNYETLMLVEKLVSNFSKLSHYDFSNDDQLITGLLAHVIPSLNRMRNKLEIRNPLLKEIKETYHELFMLVKESARALNMYDEIIISDDEIGYLTLHFGAAIERLKYKNKPKRLHLGVVCASGIGVSTLLSSKIQSHFPDIYKVIPLSVEEIVHGHIQGIDLLVATLEIESVIPTVFVNPLLKADDLKLIREAIDKIKFETQSPLNRSQQFNYEIIHNIGLTTLDVSKSKLMNLLELSKQCTNSVQLQEKIYDALIKREAHSVVYIAEKRFIMYHASVEGLLEPIVMFLKANQAQPHPDYQNVETGVLMLIPKPAKAEDRVTMSNISKVIIEDDRLHDAIQQEDLNQIKKVLVKCMEEYQNE